jgi:diguanylate cyclase (GGDEF)-like protein/PAS domain S-box-containing protein
MDADALLLNASEEILILVDEKTLAILAVNRATLALLGYTCESLIGLPIGEIECALSDIFFWDEVLSQRGSSETGGAYRCADGSILEVTKTACLALKSDSLFVVRANPVGHRKRIEEELLEMSSRLSATLEATADGILLVDSENTILNMNHRFSKMWGLSKTLLENRDDAGIFAHMSSQLMQAQQGILTSLIPLRDADDAATDTLCLLDGRVFELTSLSARSREQIVGRVYSYRDVTEYKRVENQLRISASVFDSQEAIMITDARAVILRVNHAFTSMTGYTAEEVIGKNPRVLSSGRHDASFYAAMWKCVQRTGRWDGEIWNRRKSGEIYPERLAISAVKAADGTVTNYVATITDITMSREAADEIQHLAFYDSLTRLPNRRLLMDRLQQALASSTRSGREGALLFIDLDNFKTINDTLGHDIGDLLLQQVALRLESCVREGDTVARIGGDEFVVILEDLSEYPIEAAAQTEDIGEKILAALGQLYQLASHKHRSTASIGVTLFNGHQQVIDELLKQADIAMYEAKDDGLNRLRFFDIKMQEVVNARATLEEELHKALESGQFQLHYQIQVDSLRRPLGAEALIRWMHPERGMVAPAQFIPLAEEIGLILPIGQWVLETACAQLAAWQQDMLTRDLILAVNVSAKQFNQADFVAKVRATVQCYGINPMRLKLELTEGLFLENIEDVIATMNALKEIGVQFSLDDFGTGYSSLQYLKRLPLSQLKIDQSFVRDLAVDGSDSAIVSTIIAMARNLNLDVIAEGVETEDQQQLLLDSGCLYYQGYLFGRPMPIEQFEALLKQH